MSSVSTDSQIMPAKYFFEWLSYWASLLVPRPLAYQRHQSSKVKTPDSLFRLVICQVTLAVPLYQLRSSGGTSGRTPLGSLSRPVFWVRNSTFSEYQRRSLMMGPEMVGLTM